MTTPDEVAQIIGFFDRDSILKDRVVIYACTSGYPVPFDQLCLLEIKKLIDNFGDRVKSVGFSGHHLGIAADIAAYALGAEWIERHFTKDRTWKGTDHAASLEPSGLSKLIRDLNAVSESMSYKNADILDIEKPQREKLKWKKEFKL
jgi:N-acetylneuraminate synthase